MNKREFHNYFNDEANDHIYNFNDKREDQVLNWAEISQLEHLKESFINRLF